MVSLEFTVHGKFAVADLGGGKGGHLPPLNFFLPPQIAPPNFFQT